MSRKLGRVALGWLSVLSAFLATPALAATVWVDWTSATVGASGSATGLLSGVTVNYSGQVIGAVTNGTSTIWAPNSSFIGGTVTASPSTVNDDIRLDGTTIAQNTLTFSSPLVNPVFAIWSLGQPGLSASFNFAAGATPTFQAGGPNAQFGGSPITVVGQAVSGVEGNGVVQFTGTFSSISWRNTPENFYAFTVGVNVSNGTVPVPEPGMLTLLGGLAFAGFAALRRRKQ